MYVCISTQKDKVMDCLLTKEDMRSVLMVRMAAFSYVGGLILNISWH
jgi:hypothetical protein